MLKYSDTDDKTCIFSFMLSYHVKNAHVEIFLKKIFSYFPISVDNISSWNMLSLSIYFENFQIYIFLVERLKKKNSPCFILNRTKLCLELWLIIYYIIVIYRENRGNCDSIHGCSQNFEQFAWSSVFFFDLQSIETCPNRWRPWSWNY